MHIHEHLNFMVWVVLCLIIVQCTFNMSFIKAIHVCLMIQTFIVDKIEDLLVSVRTAHSMLVSAFGVGASVRSLHLLRHSCLAQPMVSDFPAPSPRRMHLS